MNGFLATTPLAEGDPRRSVSPSTLNSNAGPELFPGAFMAVNITELSLEMGIGKRVRKFLCGDVNKVH